MSSDKKPEMKPGEPITMSQEKLQEMMTMASMAAAQTIANHMKPPGPSEAQIAEQVATKQQCADCGQVRAACKGKHRKAIIYPKNEDRARFFQGVRINGITYQSQNAGQEVLVPEDSNVEYMVQQWERQEDVLITGRKANHNSGQIGAGGTQGFTPAVGGWR